MTTYFYQGLVSLPLEDSEQSRLITSTKFIAKPPAALWMTVVARHCPGRFIWLSWEHYLLSNSPLESFEASHPQATPKQLVPDPSLTSAGTSVFYWEEVPFSPSCQGSIRLTCYKCNDIHLSSRQRLPDASWFPRNHPYQVCWITSPNTVTFVVFLPDISLHISWLFNWAFFFFFWAC